MASSECSVRVASYNCRSVKNSIKDVIRLCDEHDIVCLQEHWLPELVLQFNIHNEFHSISSSAVDITSDILVGRSCGGTAVLYRKSLLIPCKHLVHVILDLKYVQHLVQSYFLLFVCRLTITTMRALKNISILVQTLVLCILTVILHILSYAVILTVNLVLGFMRS
jgi:hypothetical protein